MNRTVVSLFASGGGKTEGARQAGYTPVAAIDLDPMAATCYAANLGDHIIVGNVADPERRLEVVAMAGGRCDLLLASPPCQQYSRARSVHLAPRDDAEVGIVILDYVDDLAPAHVVIENVEGYRKAEVCRRIVAGLLARGYNVEERVVDFADYGVPQHRRRLIIQARRGAVRWPAKRAHVGWYAAIEDLIPTLPDSQFAPWQLARLPEELRATVLVGKDSKLTMVGPEAPSMTILASPCDQPRALLVHPTDMRTMPTAEADDPAFTVMSAQGNAWYPRALAGRVVKFTYRALARLQTFPDGWRWPARVADACKIIGNAVPPRGMFELLAVYDQPDVGGRQMSVMELLAA